MSKRILGLFTIVALTLGITVHGEDQKKQEQQPKIVTTNQYARLEHTANVTAVAMHPDLLTAVATEDKKVHVWDRASKKLYELDTADVILSLQFLSPVELAGAGDSGIVIWKLDRPDLLPRTYHAGGGVKSFDISADGKYIATRADDQVKVWEMETQQLVATIRPEEPIYSLIIFGTEDVLVGMKGRVVKYSPQGEKKDEFLTVSKGAAVQFAVVGPDAWLYAEEEGSMGLVSGPLRLDFVPQKPLARPEALTFIDGKFVFLTGGTLQMATPGQNRTFSILIPNLGECHLGAFLGDKAAMVFGDVVICYRFYAPVEPEKPKAKKTDVREV